MILNRRFFLAAASGLAVWPALAQEAPPMLAAYERETGGRIGLYAENRTTGARMGVAGREAFRDVQYVQGPLAAFVLSRIDRGQDRLEDMIGYGPKTFSTTPR